MVWGLRGYIVQTILRFFLFLLILLLNTPWGWGKNWIQSEFESIWILNLVLNSMISSFETLFFEILIATRQHKSNGRKATLNSSNANAVKPLLIINGQCVKPDLKKNERIIYQNIRIACKNLYRKMLSNYCLAFDHLIHLH